jgi:ABC-2 family transporter
MRPLVLKELREHRWVLLALWLLSAIVLAGLLHTAKDEGSPLVAFRTSIFLLGGLSILTLANRLVVREYSGRTQLFLETLPVSRAQVIAVKWLTGAVLLAIPMAAGFLVTLHVAATQVALTSRFIQLIAVRGATFLLFAYSLAFFIALTGRYRYVLWGSLILGAFAVDTYAQFPLQQWPPIALVSKSMVFERLELPIADLMITWLITAILIAATFILSLAGEGSLVVALSQRMSPRERVGVTVAVIALVSLFAELDARKPKPAFTLHDAVISGAGASQVAVARTGKGAGLTAKLLADKMSSDMHELQTYLSISAASGIFVLPDSSIDSDVFLRATLPSSDGVVVRGAIDAEHFDQEEFRAYAVEQALEWYTHDRAQQEDRRWLLDGFTQWWIARTSSTRQDQLTQRSALAARMLHFESAHLEAQLRHWLVVREQLGDCLSDALAWRAVALLVQDVGPDRFRQLAMELFGRHLPDDARAALLESSFNDAWRRVDAPAFPTFAEGLRAALQADQVRGAAIPDAIVQEPVIFQAVAMRGGAYEVHYRLGAINATNPPFAVRYAEIGPWQPELDQESLSRVDATRSGVLPRSFQRGAILFTAIELRDKHLACTLRLGARRWELP